MPDDFGPRRFRVTPHDAARTLGVHPKTLARWRKTGEGPPFLRFGRIVRYDLSAFEPAPAKPAKTKRKARTKPAEAPAPKAETAPRVTLVPVPPAPAEQLPLLPGLDLRSQEAAKRSRVQYAPPDEDSRFLGFPVRGAEAAGGVFYVTHDDVTRFQQRFPRVDVQQSIRDALAWVEADPKNRKKTVLGMPKFLTRWMLTSFPSKETARHGNPTGRSVALEPHGDDLHPEFAEVVQWGPRGLA